MADDVQWFQIRSWHILKGYTGVGLAESWCGKARQAPVVDDRPKQAKTCESCLRLAGPK